MSERILTLNAGSSSVKFALYSHATEPALIASGQVQKLNDQAGVSATLADGQSLVDQRLALDTQPFHQCAFNTIFEQIGQHLPEAEVVAVGHRVVHGGLEYAAPTVIDEKVLSDLDSLTPFAPLHEPHNIEGIHAALAAFPGTLQVACFDTAFHRQQSYVNDVFAVPRRYYEQGVRRYGFHGLSYDYIASELARQLPDVAGGRVVVAHLGSGASMCGMRKGVSVSTTMGFSALDGLPMGTRCGEIDPGVILYMLDHEGLSAAEISDLLYKESGLLGISGISSDMRTLESSDSLEAKQAIDYFVYRVRRELGGLTVSLDGLDALVFTGGIGEHSAGIREKICAGLDWFDLMIDSEKNARNAFDISATNSQVKVLVIPTNEELVIARAVTELQRQ
ncbi:acetate/propionate family kinase [Pseudomaricurvus sp.]|uniref:acetate/propionate family kinase n=1 Tax=Pseudomaricurvus sp. TaxID=2004510 RepID=UPI003F6B6496